MNERTKRGGTVVGFRLRQIQGVFPLDRARRHIVADRHADDLAGRRDYQRHLRFRYIPGRIAADTDRVSWRDDAAWIRLEEQFGAVCDIDLVVEVAAALA